tara:strand:- start:2139 stop:2408 length:270 start_codon:yes stop_codon:yes gene_type:complete
MSTGRYSLFEIDSGYALKILSHNTTFYTGTTCKAKKLGDWLNNRTRFSLWLICLIKKGYCFTGRLLQNNALGSDCDIQNPVRNTMKVKT